MSIFDLDLPLNERLENMSEMMSRLGIGPATAATEDHIGEAIVLASAVRSCETCDKGQACRAWLKRAAQSLYRAPAFCPNADRFAQLIAAELAALRGKISGR